MSSISSMCPICLSKAVETAGACGHGLCRTCSERLLLPSGLGQIVRSSSSRGTTTTATTREEGYRLYSVPNDLLLSSSSSSLDETLMDVTLLCPTLGPCPICRAPLDFFQLKNITTTKTEEKEEKEEKEDIFTFEKDLDVDLSPLAGLSFVPWNTSTITMGTIHFPHRRAHTEEHFLKNEDHSGRLLPYLTFEQNNNHTHDDNHVDEYEKYTLDNGASLPKQIFFQHGCHYCSKSNTFHGTIDWESHRKDNEVGLTWNGARIWDFIIQFSSDFRYVSSGAIFKRRNNPLTPTTTTTIILPLGPTHLSYRRNQRIVLPNDHYSHDHDNNRPKYHSDSVWGNVFIQGMKVGVASYHFMRHDHNNHNDNNDDDDDHRHGTTCPAAYISYENPHCARWPPLDDGSPIPQRIFFRSCSWNAETRTFSGTIEWNSTMTTTWRGSLSWRYEMVFSSDYTYILSGTVYDILDDGTAGTTTGGGEGGLWKGNGPNLAGIFIMSMLLQWKNFNLL